MAAALALATIAAGPVMAGPVTFAQYVEIPTSAEQWTVSSSTVAGVTTTTVSATGNVLFFSTLEGLPGGGADATFTLTATSTQLGNCGATCLNTDTFSQQGFSGTFSFTDTDSGAFNGDNLLSGTFATNGTPATSGAQFNSTVGGSGGGFEASASTGDLGQLIFTSSLLTFTGAIEEDASFSLSSLIPDPPGFAVMGITTGVNGTQAYPSAGPFDAAGTGTFAYASSVPEPATLGLVGGALLGLGFLGRKRVSRQ
jgi:hypothetical protein